MKTIYIDTSVFGGKFDDEFKFWTNHFFEKLFASDIKILYSEVAKDELAGAPKKVRDFVDSIPLNSLVEIPLTEEAIKLAEAYLDKNVVGRTSRADCYHIALATIHKADLLVSWNFKHIVNIERIHGYNAVNLLNDYQIIEIRNPREVFNYED